jgi:VIT1/CCC1 family predicted Fe2+/Mn2+ transporter
MTDNTNLDPATAEFFTKLFQDMIAGLGAQVIDRIQKIEEELEAMEKRVATLVLGYGEQAVFMEALVAQLAFATDEARQKFQEDVQRARKQMLEVMDSASKGFLAEQDEDLAAALADVVAEQSATTNE